MSDNTFFNRLHEYVKSGDTVAEACYGNRPDILNFLSQTVGKKGKVYGVDEYSSWQLLNLKSLVLPKQVHLLQHQLPPFPDVCEDLDALIVREFLWLCYKDSGEQGGLTTLEPNHQALEEIERVIRPGGYLLLHLNKTEQEQESHSQLNHYQQFLAMYAPLLQQVCFEGSLLAYQKQA